MMTLNRAFDEAFAASPSSESDSTRVWVPSIDVVEKRDAYVVHADLPGVDRSSVEITFEKNILTISGKKRLGERDRRPPRGIGEARSAPPIPLGICGDPIDPPIS